VCYIKNVLVFSICSRLKYLQLITRKQIHQ
jgi:hypothetical protein